MGFHICEYCGNETSSGDVTLSFDTGRSWVMPDLILHYMADHLYLPPDEFITDVLFAVPVASSRGQTKGLARPTPVGYLTGEFRQREERFKVEHLALFMRLWQLMRQTERDGARSQTRGMR